MELTTTGERGGESRHVWCFHAPGDEAVRSWSVSLAGRRIEVEQGPVHGDKQSTYYLLRDEDDAAASCQRWREQKNAEGWLQVRSSSFDNGISQQTFIALPRSGTRGEALRQLTELLPKPTPRPASTLTDAVSRQDLEATRAFLDQGADVNEKTVGFASPLVPAASRGDLELVELLLEHGADPDPEGAFISPVDSAVRAGHVEVLDRLIAAGAALDPSKGLLGTVLSGDSELMARMIALGADVDYCPDPNLTHTPLEFALALGDHQAVQLLLAHGAGFKPPPTAGEVAAEENAEALIEAIEEGDADRVRALLDAGVPPTPGNWYDTHPLSEAAEAGDPEIVRLLLDAGADANRYFETPPLGAAAAGGHLEVARLLLDAGCRVDQQDEESDTPLMHAAWGGHLEMVRLLLERGADPQHRSESGTALTEAARGGQVEIYQVLLPLTTDEEIRDWAEQSLAEGVEDRERRDQADPQAEDISDAVLEDDVEALAALLDGGAPVDAADEDGQTPLHLACNLGRVETARLLLERGATVDAVAPQEGTTPLLSALERGSFDLARLLLENGADVNFARLPRGEGDDEAGRTPLITAAIAMPAADPGAMMQQMLGGGLMQSLGIDLGALGGAGDVLGDVIDEAGGADQPGVEAAGGEGAEDEDPEGDDGKSSNSDMVRHLVELGAEVDQQDAHGMTALVTVCRHGSPSAAEVIERLLELGADPDHRDRSGTSGLMYATARADEGGYHSEVYRQAADCLRRHGASELGLASVELIRAAETGDTERARAALAAGAAVNHQLDSRPALYHAAGDGRGEMVRLLLEHGADPDLRTDIGFTALTQAAEHGDPEIVRLLLENGADPSGVSAGGQTAAMLARGLHAEEIKNLLELAARQAAESSFPLSTDT